MQDKEKGRLEMEIYKAIDERGGTALPNANGVVVAVVHHHETLAQPSHVVYVRRTG